MQKNTDIPLMTALLGRKPQGDYWVEVRRTDESPVVIRNAPIQYSGRPMPTLYWLVDPYLVKVIGRLESTGAVKQVQLDLSDDEIANAHTLYEDLRNEHLAGLDAQYLPSGGVGGTRRGVKCLHAHYANYLIAAQDPVGSWVHDKLVSTGEAYDPDKPGLIQLEDLDES